MFEHGSFGEAIACFIFGLTIISITNRLKVFRCQWDMAALTRQEQSEKVNGDDVADWVRSDWVESFFLSFSWMFFYFDNRLRSRHVVLRCMNDVGRDVKQEKEDCRAQTLNSQTNRAKREGRKKHQKICNIAQVCENLFAGAAEDKWNYHELLFSERCAPISSLICNLQFYQSRSLVAAAFFFVAVPMMDSRKRNFNVYRGFRLLGSTTTTLWESRPNHN